ncbi:hypothetical protein M422DRAFT_255815 [Sphaerobolus stellatus SS14]|uniref:Uncharacterized protein n=1 Tax=Sphaerobolus stellatus (strain SS14) TaxID=990650 RepID=A0A0C9VS97_SPHS4|nr:hypothetical protein M422DRAFT_255815 [Sphaerobolus stellatus SS14]
MGPPCEEEDVIEDFDSKYAHKLSIYQEAIESLQDYPVARLPEISMFRRLETLLDESSIRMEMSRLAGEASRVDKERSQLSEDDIRMEEELSWLAEEAILIEKERGRLIKESIRLLEKRIRAVHEPERADSETIEKDY